MDNLMILDLDNCISDHRHREHFLVEGDFEKYNSLCEDDHVANEHLWKDYKGKIAIFTGRPVKWIDETKRWMASKGIPDRCLIFMRSTGDHRPGYIIKEDFLKSVLDIFNIEQAYDDDPRIVEMYKKYGIPSEVISISERIERKDKVEKILDDMKKTHVQRAKEYGDSTGRTANLMKAIFPDGLSLKGHQSFALFHPFFLICVKLVRFANSGFAHKDSIHDIAVYAAMLESKMKDE